MGGCRTCGAQGGVAAWSAAVWTVTGDVAGAVAWWVGLELAVHYAEYVGVWG